MQNQLQELIQDYEQKIVDLKKKLNTDINVYSKGSTDTKIRIMEQVICDLRGIL
jgi:hypothetical protein